jgi:hypothetical protein
MEHVLATGEHRRSCHLWRPPSTTIFRSQPATVREARWARECASEVGLDATVPYRPGHCVVVVHCSAMLPWP